MTNSDIPDSHMAVSGSMLAHAKLYLGTGNGKNKAQWKKVQKYFFEQNIIIMIKLCLIKIFL